MAVGGDRGVVILGFESFRDFSELAVGLLLIYGDFPLLGSIELTVD